ncbi:gamma-butyrobetaine hydroxylase-like domain-containing protein [Camelimonas abortus]|uniref:Gamma-butyrobetaine hydroxylase-like domain-containing protein n=1 Tax=Camelimonas abortus TaxID=1017184 RepID=A0ABV7LD06_9HYPH
MAAGGDAAFRDVQVEELRLNPAKDALAITFSDGRSGVLAAEFLRVWSPSAEVRGHGGEGRRTVGGKRRVKIAALEPVGSYAVRIVFDDGHDTGLYGWRLLREMVENRQAMWRQYEAELAARGMGRD